MNNKDGGNAAGFDAELAVENGRRLTKAFFETRERLAFEFTLEQCLAREAHMVAELRTQYLPYFSMTDVRFLDWRYFEEHERFIRFQDVPDRYFKTLPEHYYFISHRWLSLDDPDPEGRQFIDTSAYLRTAIPPAVRPTVGFWFDFSCVPQRNSAGHRTDEEEALFQANLKMMHLLPLLSSSLMLFDEHYMDRAWCFMEWACASRISPLASQLQHVPLFNHIKFRHLATLVLFLMQDNADRSRFLEGGEQEDVRTINHLNRLVQLATAGCVSTIEDDKRQLVSLLHEHFWNHLRFIGFRTLLMTAVRLLERFDAAIVEQIMWHFLSFTSDPQLRWIKESTFVLESIVATRNPTDMIFHRNEIRRRGDARPQDEAPADPSPK